MAASWRRPPSAGDVIGRFELLREIGRGGFGMVFEARDRELGRPVAFKALKPSRALDPAHAEALRAEAAAAARLNHPSIVTVHDFGTCASGPYVIMELLRGEPLAAAVARGPMPPREAVRIGAAVARALAEAHAAGVLHRDLNPGNVFLVESGTVKVLDFGLARVLGSGGLRGGTPAFMAPEQWRGGPQDARTDLFGLGCLLFRMIAGEVPFPDPPDVWDDAPDPEPPRLAVPGTPRRLARLVQRLLARDPRHRPASAAAVLAELEEVARRLDPSAAHLRRRRTALAAGAGLLLGAAGVAALLRPGDRGPDRPTVAVADFENATGERELDGLSGLLTTALEQSRRLQVLTRDRLWDELRAMGRADVPRIDEALAREIGRRAGVDALLLASIRRYGPQYAVELRALDPSRDRYLFTLSERAEGQAAIPDLVDRLADRARRELRDGSAEVVSTRRPVGESLTRNLEAYRHYFLGVECMARNEDSEQVCPDHFRRALAIDPDFALAHHQLAYLLGAEWTDAEGARRENALALRHAGRVPPKERALIQAFQAELDDRPDEAVARYGEAAERYPDDPEVFARAGYYLHRRRDYARALPFMRRAVALDPTSDDTRKLLVQELVQTGGWAELRSAADAWERLPPSPGVTAALVRVRFWLGDRERALRLARERAAAGGTAAHHEEAVVLFAQGEFAAAEAALEQDVQRHLDDAYVRAGRVQALAAQGRLRQALAAYERPPATDNPAARAIRLHARAALAAAGGRPAPVWQAARACFALDRRIGGALASDLALLGDVAHARILGAGLEPGSLDAQVLEALLAWRSGDTGGAVARLQALAAAEPVASWWGVPASFALAEVASAAGDDAAVLEAVRRLLTAWHPMGSRGGWMVPRALLLQARARLRTGHAAGARDGLAALLAQRRGGDPGDPIAAEARTLLARLDRGR